MQARYAPNVLVHRIITDIFFQKALRPIGLSRNKLPRFILLLRLYRSHAGFISHCCGVRRQHPKSKGEKKGHRLNYQQKGLCKLLSSIQDQLLEIID
jgi:hypothetical protein